MSDRERPLELGVSLVPEAAEISALRELAVRADALGLDLIGIQDHPYLARFLETWLRLADLLARTERIRVFLELGIDTLVFWPGGDRLEQLERFVADVVPGVREAVGSAPTT